MAEEIDTLYSHSTWELVAFPPDKSPIGCRWVYTIKIGLDGMIRNTADHSVFYNHTSTEQCIYLIVYVDDIVITGQDGIQKLKQHLFSHVHTKDLEKLKYFLSIKVTQSNSGMVISQRKYTLDILANIGMLDRKSVDTPMDLNVKLVPGQGEPLRDPGRY